MTILVATTLLVHMGIFPMVVPVVAVVVIHITLITLHLPPLLSTATGN
jgi:hypothetical protein